MWFYAHLDVAETAFASDDPLPLPGVLLPSSVRLSS